MNPSFNIQNLIYLVLSLVGGMVLFTSLRSRRQAETSQSWQGTRGRITESRLDTRTTITDGIESTAYQAVVVYAYTVMGQEYTGKQVAFGVHSATRKAASAVLERYPLDRQVTVYYDPQKPGQAVLERVSTSGLLHIVIGLLLIFTGIYLAFR